MVLALAAAVGFGGACTSSGVDTKAALRPQGPVPVLPPGTLPVPGLPASAACASASFCEAAVNVNANPSYLLEYSGDAWRSLGPVVGSDNVDGISCPSPTWCMAAGDQTNPSEGLAIISTGTETTQTVLTGVDSLNGVSCPESGYCVAVGVQEAANKTNTVGLVYDGGRWSNPTLVGRDSWATQISCSSRSFCLSTAYSGSDRTADQVFTYVDGHWTTGHTLGYQQSPFLAVSCPTDGDCIVVDGGGHTYRLKDHIWTQSTSDDGQRYSVACVGPDSCFSVGTVHNAFAAWTLNDLSWSKPTIVRTAPRGGSDSYATGVCAPTGQCLSLVGVGDDTGWHSTVSTFQLPTPPGA